MTDNQNDEQAEIVTAEENTDVTIRIASLNDAFAYKGTMFKRIDDVTGAPKDYTVTADLADYLCDGEDSIFRRVDADGELIPSEIDEVRADAAEDDRAARTFYVPKAEKPAQEVHEVKPKPAGKPKVMIKSAKAATPSPAAPTVDPTTEGGMEG